MKAVATQVLLVICVAVIHWTVAVPAVTTTTPRPATNREKLVVILLDG